MPSPRSSQPGPAKHTSLGQQILLEQSASVRLVLTRLVQSYATAIAEHGCRMTADHDLRGQCDRLVADISSAAESYARVLDMMGWPLEQACRAITEAVTEGGAVRTDVHAALRERALQCARNIYRNRASTE